MTPEELKSILALPIAQLSDIFSFFLGALCGIAFVVASNTRWDR